MQPLSGMSVRDVSKPLSAMAQQGEVLATLQEKAAYNYFRVLQAYERLNPLRQEPYGVGKQSFGELLTRELERERARIARELHAGAGQPLAGIKLNLDLLRSNLVEMPQPVEDSIARLQLLAEQALEQVRALSHRLYPPEWQRLALGDAIANLWKSSGVAQKLECRVDIQSFYQEPPHAVKVTIYRCCQECLSNILRHSGATSAALSLRQEGVCIVLSIEDNGSGFDVPDVLSADSRARGIGLVAMREQASSLGGSLDIQSGQGGTKLRVSLPLVED